MCGFLTRTLHLRCFIAKSYFYLRMVKHMQISYYWTSHCTFFPIWNSHLVEFPAGPPCFMFVSREVIVRRFPRSPVSAGCYLVKIQPFLDEKKKKVLSVRAAKRIPANNNNNNNIIPTIFSIVFFCVCRAHGVSSQQFPSRHRRDNKGTWRWQKQH